ncbi:hypothetical protein BMG_6457 (plasmid) [Priestia megaterium]|uniref:hypothetical protein n=1 Tax=Priestia megaterium TaxID=1404 RepID=UPI0015DBE586|nr:hypothetical protein [Priestia megaterium]QLK09679.1 hypothetical protein BMG_6457 [Priestia megaterium]
MESEDFFNIEESSILNGLYLILVLKNKERTTIDELATALYLYRFPFITKQIIDKEEEVHISNLFSHAELNNLDTMLYPFLLEKYNNRFISSLKELLARELVDVEQDYVYLKKELDMKELLNEEAIIQIDQKLGYIVKVINSMDYKTLKKKIEEIVGEKHWKTHSL